MLPWTLRYDRLNQCPCDLCRSELAREKGPDAALIQNERVNVDSLREQACSYSGLGHVAQRLRHRFNGWRGVRTDAALDTPL